jgi:pimeloyl-ACP methyl ester carboxylesterase
MTGAWSDELSNIRAWHVPLAVFMGENDTLIEQDYLVNSGPFWREGIHRIAGAGHVVNEENPEAFNALLAAFAAEQLG